MIDKAQEAKRSYFSNEACTAAFNDAFLRRLGDVRKPIVAKYLPPENTHRFRHSGNWDSPGNPEALGGEMQQHSAVLETRFDDIVANDLGLIERSIQHIVEAMDRQFAVMFYSSMSSACDRTGNVVDAKAEGSPEAAFMAMIEKIDFAVDRDGNVPLPQIHAGREAFERMVTALEATPPEYRERFEALKARKTEEALQREAERKAKFVRYGSDPCAS